jgi:2-oxoglutarate dehydrogenase E2 component (dihydrolipoamide succinyltransferase)
MGESIAEGTVTKWYKKVGDRVERDEPLFEISTDKVDTEIPSPAAGVLIEIRVGEGETVPINTVVAVIGEKMSQAAASAPAPPPASAPAQKEPGVSLPAQAAVTVGATERGPRSSPLVRKIAREHGLDLGKVAGTGEGGRITKHDVLSVLSTQESAAAPPPPKALTPPVTAAPRAAPSAPSPPRPASVERPRAPTSAPSAPSAKPATAPSPSYTGRVDVEPMSAMRKSIAEHMVISRRTSAHVTTVFEVDMSRIVAAREDSKRTFERDEGVKLTYTPFFVRAVTSSLKGFPLLNASIDGDRIVRRRELNIGVAVSLDGGLIVPVIHRADEKSFLGLARAVGDLAERARTKKLRPEEVQGGTFTVTNPGPYGSLFGTPIINQPQVAILGVGGIHKRPVVVNDAIAVRSMVYLALSFDHRLVDGALADQFMADLKRRLEGWDEKVL